MQEQLRELIDRSVTRKYNAGATIFYQGEAPRSAAIIVSGIIRVFSISHQGDEQIVMFHIDGEFFPSSWIFGKAPSTLFFYEAVTDCEIAFAPRQDLIQHLLATHDGTHALLDYFTTNFAASLIHVNALEQPKARDKLMYTLYFLCQRFGKKTNGKVLIPLTLTHKTLASLVGLTRETTATELSKLRKQKAVTYDNQKYVVDTDVLLDLIGEDSFRTLKIGV